MSASAGKRGKERWARKLLMSLGLAVGGASGAWAQAPEKGPALPPKSYMNKNVFYLPVTLDDRTRAGLQEIQLWAKENPAQPWSQVEKISPQQTYFNFKASHDGEYWFTVVTVDKAGRTQPPDLALELPGLVVVLDSQPPQLDVSALPGAGDGTTVKVDVRDTNPDLAKTRFSFQTGDQTWRPLEPIEQHPNQFCIPRQAVLTGLIRVVGCDLAGNTVTREYNLSTLSSASVAPVTPGVPGSTGSAAVSGSPTSPLSPSGGMPRGDAGAFSGPVAQPKGAPTQPAPFMVKPEVIKEVVEPVPAPKTAVPAPGAGPVTQLVDLQGTPSSTVRPAGAPIPALEGAGKVTPAVDGPAKTAHAARPAENPMTNKQIVNQTHVQLEYQIDQMGASGVGKVEVWITRDRGESWQKHGEDLDRKSPAEVDLPGEGLFGVSLVVTNGRGFGGTPPKAGDAADWWVEVDQTRPIANLSGVKTGADETGALHITWVAHDKNLTPAPIDLYYALDRKGPWVPIAKSIKNEGQYVWQPPGDIGPHALIRMVVSDVAGNVTQCETPQPVALDDLSRPRCRVVGVSGTPRVSVLPQLP